MKALLLVLALVSPFAANAKSYRLTPETAPFLVDALLRAGVKPNVSKALYTLSVDELSCMYREIQDVPVTDPEYGTWSYGCSIPHISDGSAKGLYDLFENSDRVKFQEGDAYPEIGDCGMGKCMLTIKAVRCTIDSKQMEHDKRFACTIEDGVS